MTRDSKMPAPLDPAFLAERFQTLATKSQAAVQDFLVNRPDVANIGMGDPAQIGQAFFELTTRLIADPRPVARAQIELWEQSVSLWARTWRHLLGGEPPPSSAAGQALQTPRMGRKRHLQLHPRQLSAFRARRPFRRPRRQGTRCGDIEKGRILHEAIRRCIGAVEFRGDKP